MLRTLLVLPAAAAVALVPLAAQAATVSPPAAVVVGTPAGSGDAEECDAASMSGRISNTLSQALHFEAAGLRSGMQFVPSKDAILPHSAYSFEHRGREAMPPDVPRLGAAGYLQYTIGDTSDRIVISWDRSVTPGTASAKAEHYDGSPAGEYVINVSDGRCDPVVYSVGLKG